MSSFSPYYLIIFTIIIKLSHVITERGSYVGCYDKRFNNVKQYIFGGDVDSCLYSCEVHFFRYAALTIDRCTCYNSIVSLELDKHICNTTCSNDTNLCGGTDAETYYETNIKVPGPPRNPSLGLQRTDTSVVLRWEPPEFTQFLSKYIIEAKILQTYANFMILPPIWTFQNTSIHAEVVNLHPGTRYNFTIKSASEYGEGGSVFIEGETKIGIPDPEPEEPKILKTDEQTIKIEINPAVNNNGPISAYHVVVHFPEEELLQHFDENYLKDYKESQENGIPYYIAAELKIKNRTEFTVGDGKMYQGYFNAPLPLNSHVHISIGIISSLNGVRTSKYSISTHQQHELDIIHFEYPVLETQEVANSALVIVLSIACIIFGLLLIGSVGAYIYLRKKLGNQNRLRRLSDNHEMSIHGPIIEAENTAYTYDPDENLNLQQNLKFLLDKLHVEQKLLRNSLTLDIDHIIGTGEFGDVIRGSVHRDNKSYSCQVHVISDDMEKQVEKKFLKDLNNFINLTPHKIFLQFHGVCVVADWMYIVIEDVPYTLKRHLLVSRETAQTGKISFIPEINLLRMMKEITSAMEYLSSKNVIHKQLCSYNIKITSQQTIKLSVFGPTLNDEQGKSIDLTRWFAPEVLKFNNHSVKSDVWSLGCVMWECSCLGATLYPNINSVDLLARIKNGARPEQPTFVYDDLYQLFLNCWEMDPKDRPSIQEISDILNQLLSSPKHALCFDQLDNNGIGVLPYHFPLLEFKT